MKCKNILEMAYEEDSACTAVSFFKHAQIWLHTLFCEECAQKIGLFNAARSIMHKDFFPSPESKMEDSIMEKINTAQNAEEEQYASPGFSTRGWIIAGLVILISFAAAFFGIGFQNMTDEIGTSFILPIGIIFGSVLTVYCALFIGSHLKELSEKFGL